MRVTLSPLTFDPLGCVSLHATPDTDMGERRRRMNRVATLDGGAVFNDAGFSHADRTITLAWRPTPSLHAAVERLLQLYGRVYLATNQGFFLVGVEVYAPSLTQSSPSTLSLLVAAKLA